MESPPPKEKKASLFFKQDAKRKADTGKSTPKKVSVKTVVTGGAGYFGFTLGRALAKTGTDVIIYDIKKPLWPIPQGVVLVQVFRFFRPRLHLARS